MKTRAIHVLVGLVSLAALLSAPATLPLRAADKPPLKLKVGDMAPDFTLKYFDGAKLQDISLHEFRGKKNVLVAFFVFAFTGG
jgi:cytochrome oxidase Cu insertion factor (SCO1/SenC/PrrC family)